MKNAILFLFLISPVLAGAQSLKDALYGGKLKNDAGTVIRKGEDLSSKIDTTRKAPAPDTAVAAKAAAPSPADTSIKKHAVTPPPAAITDGAANDNISTATDTASAGEPDDEAAATGSNPAAPKSNNTLWKEHVNKVADALKTEVLSNKKIRRGSYYAVVAYTIGPDGEVTVGDVSLSPENGYLQQQIKDRLSVDAPRLSPALTSSGTPRKVTRRYSFTLVKD